MAKKTKKPAAKKATPKKAPAKKEKPQVELGPIALFVQKKMVAQGLGIEMVLAAEKHNYKLFCELLAKTEYMDKVQLWRVLKACNRHFRDTGSG